MVYTEDELNEWKVEDLRKFLSDKSIQERVLFGSRLVGS